MASRFATYPTWHGVRPLRRFREHDDIICVEQTPQLSSGSRTLGTLCQSSALFRQHFSKRVNEDKEQDRREGNSLANSLRHRGGLRQAAVSQDLHADSSVCVMDDAPGPFTISALPPSFPTSHLGQTVSNALPKSTKDREVLRFVKLVRNGASCKIILALVSQLLAFWLFAVLAVQWSSLVMWPMKPSGPQRWRCRPGHCRLCLTNLLFLALSVGVVASGASLSPHALNLLLESDLLTGVLFALATFSLLIGCCFGYYALLLAHSVLQAARKVLENSLSPSVPSEGPAMLSSQISIEPIERPGDSVERPASPVSLQHSLHGGSSNRSIMASHGGNSGRSMASHFEVDNLNIMSSPHVVGARQMSYPHVTDNVVPNANVQSPATRRQLSYLPEVCGCGCGCGCDVMWMWMWM
eukprot:g79506.t1